MHALSFLFLPSIFFSLYSFLRIASFVTCWSSCLLFSSESLLRPRTRRHLAEQAKQTQSFLSRLSP